jgi:glyoxylase I family protein
MKPDLEAFVVNLENSLLDESVRKSDQLSELLADDFVEIGSSGATYTKQQVIAALKTEAPREIIATEFKARELFPGNVLVSYRARQDNVPTLRTSLWQQRAGRWQLVFHQGTIAPASS